MCFPEYTLPSHSMSLAMLSACLRDCSSSVSCRWDALHHRCQDSLLLSYTTPAQASSVPPWFLCQAICWLSQVFMSSAVHLPKIQPIYSNYGLEISTWMSPRLHPLKIPQAQGIFSKLSISLPMENLGIILDISLSLYFLGKACMSSIF